MDNFLKFKNQFAIPEGTIYLNGNSLGPPLKSTGDVIKTFVEEEWGKELIKAWNTKLNIKPTHNSPPKTLVILVVILKDL